jgi:hypothetical protein
LLDPLPNIRGTRFDFDAVLLTTTQKIYGFLVDKCDVRQVQDQLLARCFGIEQYSQVIDVSFLDAATELEQNSALARSLNFEHANFPMACDAKTTSGNPMSKAIHLKESHLGIGMASEFPTIGDISDRQAA